MLPPVGATDTRDQRLRTSSLTGLGSLSVILVKCCSGGQTKGVTSEFSLVSDLVGHANSDLSEVYVFTSPTCAIWAIAILELSLCFFK